MKTLSKLEILGKVSFCVTILGGRFFWFQLKLADACGKSYGHGTPF
jgi:hypothetical protein